MFIAWLVNICFHLCKWQFLAISIFARIEKEATEIWCMLSMRGRVEGGGEGVMHLECLAPQYIHILGQ